MKTCCVIGHRTIELNERLKNRTLGVLENLIAEGTSAFLFGSKSSFDDMCLTLITDLKKRYGYVKRVYVRSDFEYIGPDYQEYLAEFYDDTYFPENVRNAGRLSYVKRNEEMINKSDVCLFYYDENYSLFNKPSGTKIAYAYAAARHKKIINLFESRR